MKATKRGGRLEDITECYIEIGDIRITMNILPDISDQKNANYSDESAIGRSMPYKTFNNSENRSIGWTVHFIATNIQDFAGPSSILRKLRLLESAVYPREGQSGAPYSPPPICKLKCGEILGSEPLCAVMKSYSVKFDPTIPWDPVYHMPYKLDVDLQFDVVYNQKDLPGSNRILRDGR